MNRKTFVDTEHIEPQHVYRTLEQLIKRKEKIEVGIFKELQRTLGLKVDIMFYDLTSTYFGGEGPELAGYRYSRDHRPDRKQLVLVIAMIEGIPIFHEVFEGNTADKTTLRHAVRMLKERFDLKRIIFVADGDLFSQDILCINKDTEREERERLKELRRSFKHRLKELADSCVRMGEGRKSSQKGLINQIMKILGRHKRLFDVKFDDGLTYSSNRETWKYENAIAGRLLLVTTSDLAAKRVMESYKELRGVKQAFNEIKHFVDIRPIYHFNDDMVRAHVFVCVLAYLTEAMIGRLVPYQSARKIIQELRELQVVRLTAKKCRGAFLKEPSESDRALFKLLGIPISEKLLEHEV